ncbi:ABC transporter permease [Cochlodiniinecator piscidefendens]|uniref:ABC transporter permease n=1 Tax=Cochlodiniinecator piscidefendens TaxID=2715756 RepID=UPI00140B1772|nr:ABC transporter permease subunit [Cochlodiniinecator piscidefendens]
MATNYREMSAAELLALEPPGWGGALLDGLAISLQVAVLGYLIGILIGLGGAVLKRSGGPITRDLMGLYTTLVRAIPELVLILLAYFAMPELINQMLSGFGFERIEINGFVAGVVVIGFVQGAYATEVLRGAMGAVPVGHIEAAQSFGMHPLRIFARITVPEMLPSALPGLSNLWLIATKDTALLAVVGFTELTLAARQAAGATKQYFLFLLAAGALYLIITLLSGWIFRLIENRVNRGAHHV